MYPGIKLGHVLHVITYIKKVTHDIILHNTKCFTQKYANFLVKSSNRYNRYKYMGSESSILNIEDTTSLKNKKKRDFKPFFFFTSPEGGEVELFPRLKSKCQKVLIDENLLGLLKYAQRWKIDFNPLKSAALVFQKGKSIMMRNFTLNGYEIPQTENVEYLGLPIGNSEFFWNFVEEKWNKEEMSFYSLYCLGCKPKAAPPGLVGFLFKQFCQTIFRYHLDLVFVVKSVGSYSYFYIRITRLLNKKIPHIANSSRNLIKRYTLIR
ncbi:hypothetical protein BpHYR1_041057, partial [Brachionus plicatilis]